MQTVHFRLQSVMTISVDGRETLVRTPLSVRVVAWLAERRHGPMLTLDRDRMVFIQPHGRIFVARLTIKYGHRCGVRPERLERLRETLRTMLRLHREGRLFAEMALDGPLVTADEDDD